MIRARRPHYAWVVAGAAFLTLLEGSGFRSAPTVMINPLGDEFGWRVDQISLAIAINLVLFGLMAPFSAALLFFLPYVLGSSGWAWPRSWSCTASTGSRPCPPPSR